MLASLENLFLLIAPFTLLIQIGCCVHAYKTGRPYWWIWILLMGSLVGCLLYFILEILPDASRNSPRLIKTSWFVPRSVRLRRTRELAEDSPTVANKLSLAALLSDFGQPDEAEAVAAECPSGVFKEDPEVIAEVAWYKLAVGKNTEAEQLLAQANTKHNRHWKTHLDLLLARVRFAQGEFAAARRMFEALVPTDLGEEPRYYLALCLLKLEQRDTALELLTDITKKYRKGGVIWRRAEKKWFKVAKKTINEIQLADRAKPAAVKA